MTTTPTAPLTLEAAPEQLKVVAWGTTRTLDGKQILAEMCVATNPAYVKVHNHHAWEPLIKLTEAQSALSAQAATIAQLEEDARRYRWLREQAEPNRGGERPWCTVRDSKGYAWALGSVLDAAIDAAIAAHGKDGS